MYIVTAFRSSRGCTSRKARKAFRPRVTLSRTVGEALNTTPNPSVTLPLSRTTGEALYALRSLTFCQRTTGETRMALPFEAMQALSMGRSSQGARGIMPVKSFLYQSWSYRNAFPICLCEDAHHPRQSYKVRVPLVPSEYR